jgi:16S rRNA pseudouridine516 synthase
VAKLDQLLARNLGCSRAQARKLLGNRADGFSSQVSDQDLPLALDLGGTSVRLYDAFHLLLNKPAGCVTALRDAQHPTARSCLGRAPLWAELRPVGRLDIDTTGLLLWTTNGELLHRLTQPKRAIPRSYHVGLAREFGPLPRDLILRDGHRPNVIDLRRTREHHMHPSLQRAPEATAFASITIGDGAYHEVRRIFAALGSHVVSLCRVSFGAVELPSDLAPGDWRPVERTALMSELTSPRLPA